MTELVRCRPLLGTYVEITVGADDGAASRAIEAAFETVATVHALMSFHAPESELSRLNAARAGDELALHPWTVAVLRFSLALYRVSHGLFDPGAGGARVAGLVVLDDTHVRVREPVRLDLGGVAKGFAVDCAIDALAAHGVRDALVNAGGDLRVLGAPRAVHVRRPDDPTHLLPLGEIGDGALATSAAYFGGKLLDPASGQAVTSRRSFTVVAPTCMVADGLTKVLALAGELPAACAERWDARAVVLP